MPALIGSIEGSPWTEVCRRLIGASRNRTSFRLSRLSTFSGVVAQYTEVPNLQLTAFRPLVAEPGASFRRSKKNFPRWMT